MEARTGGRHAVKHGRASLGNAVGVRTAASIDPFGFKAFETGRFLDSARARGWLR